MYYNVFLKRKLLFGFIVITFVDKKILRITK